MSYRPYVNGAGQSGGNLNTDGWPISASDVLLQGDKIKIDGDSTEYTVQSNVNSDGDGLATIPISPNLASSPADGTPVLVPAPRTMTSQMRASVAAEQATLVHFLRFNFALTKKISAFADAGGGQVTVTSANHTLENGAQIKIYCTDSYNGTYTISNVTTDTFRITDTYVATETGGLSVEKPIFVCTAPHDVGWDSKTWQGLGGNIGFEPIDETDDLGGNSTTVVLSGVDRSIVSAILTYDAVGRHVKIWRGHIGTDGNIISDPRLLFWGLMNGGFECEEEQDGERPGTVTVRGRMVNRLGDLNVVRGVQTNPASHQLIFEDDKFFSHVHALMTRTIVWGKQ